MNDQLRTQLVVTASTKPAVEAVRQITTETAKIGPTASAAGATAAAGLGKIDAAATATQRTVARSTATVRDLVAETAEVAPVARTAGAAAAAGLGQIEAAGVRAQAAIAASAATTRQQVLDTNRVIAQSTASAGPGIGGTGAISGLAASARTIPLLAAALTTLKLGQFAKETGEAGLQLNNLDITLETVFGSAAAAGSEFEFVRRTATRLSLELEALGSGYALLAASTKNTKLEGQATREIFLAVAEAGGKMQLSGEAINGTLAAFRQIASGATLQTEELNQISERIPGTFQIAARALGVSTGEVKALVAEGKVATSDFLPKFAAELRKTFGTSATTEIRNYRSGFQELTQELKIMARDGFTPVAESASNAASAIATFVKSRNDSAADQRAREAGTVDLGNGLAVQRGTNRVFRRGVFGALEDVEGFNPSQLQAALLASGRGDFRNEVPFAPRPTLPNFSALVPQPLGAPALTGARLLSEGAPVADAKELARLGKERIELEAKLAGLTNVQRVQQSILTGELRGQNVLEQDGALRLAELQDRLIAQQKEQKADRRDGTKELAEQQRRVEAIAAIEERSRAAGLARTAGQLEAVLTPQERFQRDLAQLNSAVRSGDLARAAARKGLTPEDAQNRILMSLAPVATDTTEEAQRTISALEVFAEQGARNIQDSFATFLFDPLDEGLKGFLKSFIDTLRQVAAQTASSAILGSLFKAVGLPFGGASGGGGASGSLLGAGGVGGSFVGGRAGGGLISGPGSGTSDSILARVSHGEYVVKASSVRRVGVGFLDAVNAGLPGFADGGLVAAGLGGAGAGFGAGLAPIVVQVDARNSADPVQTAQLVARAVREAAVAFDKRRARGMRAGD